MALDSLDQEKQDLLAEAEKAMEHAYNPYSGFSVGAALLSQNGKTITAENLENAAYSPSIWAPPSQRLTPWV